MHLCTVLDVFTGEMLGFNISRSHGVRFVRLAVERAIQRTGTVPLWFHSDQGSEYASDAVSSWLESFGVSISMNPKGSPWCNGSQESFFDRFDTFADLLEALYAHLSYFSNRRIKRKLKVPPAQFREWWCTRQRELLTDINKFSTTYESPPGPPSRPTGRWRPHYYELRRSCLKKGGIDNQLNEFPIVSRGADCYAFD